MITRHVLDTTPAMLNAYLDLELKADLVGGEPDTHYQKRLTGNLHASDLLQAWRQPAAISAELTDTQRQLAETKEEAELTLLQLHQTQEEMERYFLLSESQKTQQERHKKLLRSYERLVSSVVTRF